MKTGDIIKQEREKRHLSQADLAIKLGVTQPHINYLESGQRNASDRLKIQISEFFNLPVSYIFFSQNDNK